MSRFSTFLVPVDGSPLSERVLPFATALARRANGRVILLRVALGLEMAQLPELGADPSRELDELAGRLRASGVTVEPHVHYVYSLDEVADTICRVAREREAHLILMSTHGRGGLGRWLYGSVADQVLRQAEVPVLLVSAACELAWPPGGPRHLLVPLDGSPLAEEALGLARELAAALGVGLTLTQVIQPLTYAYAEGYAYFAYDPEAELAQAREYLEQAAAPLRSAGIDVRVEARLGQPAAEIAAAAREQGADLIVMATHGRGGLARVILGSVATGTLQQAGVPILLVRPTAVRQQTQPVAVAAMPPERPRPAEPQVTLSLSPQELGLIQRGLGELLLTPERDPRLAEPVRRLRERLMAAYPAAATSA